MKLAKNEYTTKTLIKYLQSKYGVKQSGTDFTANDIQQYINRKALPPEYGGKVIKVNKRLGIRTITLHEQKKRTLDSYNVKSDN